MAAAEKVIKKEKMKGVASDPHSVIFIRITIHKALRKSAWHIVKVICLQLLELDAQLTDYDSKGINGVTGEYTASP